MTPIKSKYDFKKWGWLTALLVCFWGYKHSHAQTPCPLTPPVVTYQTKTGEDCSNITLTATGCNGTVRWSDGQTGTTITGKLYSATPSSFDAVCEMACGTTGKSITRILQLGPPPTVKAPNVITTGQCVFCKNSTVTFTSSAIDNIYKYQWQKDGQNIPNATNATLSVNSEGAYKVLITYPIGCYETSLVMNATAKGKDVVSTVRYDGPNPIYVPQTALLFATLGYEAPKFKYQWQKDGKDISGATTNQYLVKDMGKGKYTVTISEEECPFVSNAVDVEVLAPLAVALNVTDELLIYPNPTDGLFMVSAQLKKRTNLRAKLIDLNGQILHTFQLSSAHHFGQLLDLSHYSSGIYILEIATENNELLKRVKILKK